jgi:hypothetical protein
MYLKKLQEKEKVGERETQIKRENESQNELG